MAKAGLISSTIFEVILGAFDIDSIKKRRQVRIMGTHIYLTYIVPNPFLKSYKIKALSTLDYVSLKTKKKTIIRLSSDDCDRLENGEVICIKSFKISKERL